MTLPVRTGATSTGHFLGWKPDLPDIRDHAYLTTATTPLPPTVRLDQSGFAPAVYDQGQLGSCTANGIAACVEYDLAAQSLPTFHPSRLFIYYGERVIEGTTSQDSGAYIRDGIKVVAKLGSPPEQDWPYDITQFAVKPPAAAYSDAKGTLAVQYKRVQRRDIMRALADGRPVVFGWTVYRDAINAVTTQNPFIPMPAPDDAVEGGHCTVAMGYEWVNGKAFLRVRNSWGATWADNGHFWMPLEYVSRPGLASDFWTVTVVS